MSLQEPSTSKEILRTFSAQENANMYRNKLDKLPKTNPEFPMSDELQKMKDDYETLERRNKEELQLIQQQFGTRAFPEFSEFRELLEKTPGLGQNRETLRNFPPPAAVTSKEFMGKVESAWDWKLDINESKEEKEKFDQLLTSKNDEITFMRNKFITFTEIYKMEAEKLLEQEERTKTERDMLQRKLEEAQRKYDEQNGFVKELEQNNLDLKGRFDQINRDIQREMRKLAIEAKIEKKRYLENLKKLIELFQMEKSRIENTITTLSTDITIERNQHFQDVAQLKDIIEQLKQEGEKHQQFYLENHKYPLSHTNVDKKYKIWQEIEEHRKYSYELEMIIKNLGVDNQNLETENAELKKKYEEKLELLQDDTKGERKQLQEELETYKHKFNSLQEVKAESEFILAENETLKANLNSIDEKYVRRVRVLNADYSENQRKMSLQIEKQNTTIQKLNTEQSELHKVISSFEENLKSKANEIYILEACRSSLESKKLELQTNLDKSRQLVEQTVRENDERVSELKYRQEIEVKSLNTEVTRLQKQIKDLQTNMVEQETIYKILKVDFTEYKSDKDEQLAKFNKEKEAINQLHEKKVEELNGKIADLQKANANYGDIEQELHKQIQGLVHNMNKLNSENQKEVSNLRQEIRKQIGQELDDLQKFRGELEDQIKVNEKENVHLKSELQFKTQRCTSLEEELKGLRVSHQDLSLHLEDSRDRYEEQLEQLKLSNERILKRNKDEIAKLLKDFEQQSLFCDHLDKRKKELEKLNKSYTDNTEQVTKVYQREMEDLKLDLQNTKKFYENKLSHSKTEAIFETKKYENRISELEQDLKIVKYEVEWLREVQKE